MWTQYSQPQPCEASASDVMALMERAYRKVYPKPPKPTSEEKVKLEADVTALKIVAKFAAQQRCAPRRSIYKRPTGSNPTVMVNTQRTEQPEGVAVAESFRGVMAAVLASQSAAPQSAAPRTSQAALPPQATLSRDEYLFLIGDLGFIIGGVIDLDDGSSIADGEAFWGFQAAENFERARMRSSCRVKLLWLARIDGSRWRLLPLGPKERFSQISNSRLIKDEEDEPIVVRVEGFPPDCYSEHGVVYTLSEETI
jgi:hypothetical protein